MVQFMGMLILAIAVIALAYTGKLDDVIIAAMNSLSSCAPPQSG